MESFKYLKDKKRLLAIIGIATAQIIVYYASRLIPLSRERIVMETGIDGCIPFLPCFIVFYVAAYAQWAFHVHMMAQEDSASFYRFIVADLFAKTICLICFIVFPTTMERPDAAPGDLFSSVVFLIYKIDKPINLFPSIHCMLTWLDMRTALRSKRAPASYAKLSVPFSLLVIISTVFVKQHVFVDTIAGILCAEAGFLLSAHLPRIRNS